ncbi:MAG: DNA polymerase ligase N-terminal domain-containing protein [Candidatus Bathyarchaeia archaeon]|jgi:DNA ligase D-like protein (predicted 3'-phosphoesterase)
MSLDRYVKKRRFTRTPEPAPKVKKTGRNRFVVQEHHARRLHWDFRLELEGVLKSWAVPKGPPEEPGLRRLAVEVEDHPIDYITFEGTIPKGQYGAGTVKIWDKGSFKLKRRTKDIYEFWLKGKRLYGKYSLVRFKQRNWLMLKSRSEN